MLIAGNSDGCRYRFIEQPANTMSCNPYPSGRLISRCAVEFTTTDGTPLQISWHFRTELGGNPHPVSMDNISSHEFNSSMSSKAESTLTIQLQNGTSSGSTHCGNFRGYFCRVTLRNGTILSDSQEIYLFPEYTISSNLKNCEKQHVQSSHTATCVDSDFSTTQSINSPSSPMTTSRVSSPEDMTETTKETTGSQSPVTDQAVTQMSSFDKVSPPTTLSRPPHMASSPPSQGDNSPPPQVLDSLTTASVHISDLDTQTMSSESSLTATESRDTPLFSRNHSANDANTPTGDDTSPLNLDDLLLYSAIGVVILLIMIVIGLVVCLCLCNKLCQKSKYCMC